MKKRLCIGLLSPSDALVQILDTIGCSVEHVKPGSELLSNYAVIITEGSAKGMKKLLSEYVHAGGAWLELGKGSVFLNRSFRPKRFIRYLVNEKGAPGTESLPFLDLYAPATVTDRSGQLSSLYSIQSFGEGVHAWSGLNPEDLWSNSGYKRKRFTGHGGPDPDEIVSATDRSGVVRFIRFILKQLHFQRDLPWISKWDSPSQNPVFCFRIDSDFGTPQSVRSVFQLCTEFNIRPTWFLHVKAHEHWLEVFHEFENLGHEIALHGYEHFTSDAPDKIRHNIQKGYQKLLDAGWVPRGFCAPYGIWNEGLHEALSSFEFDYSSEFTRLYDGTPARIGDTPLQIPIHPVCTGSLARKAYTAEQMAAYFNSVLDRKAGSVEPSLFYHHPLQPGLEAIKQLFASVQKHGLTVLTFGEYASFWKLRSENSFQAFFDGTKITVEDSNGAMWYRACTAFSRYGLLKSNQGNAVSDLTAFKYAPPSLPSPQRVRQLKKQSPELLKTSLVDWLNRQKR